MYCLPLTAVVLAIVGAAPGPAYKPAAAELQPIREKDAQLLAAVEQLSARHVDDGLLADVAVYHKAAVWALRYADDEFYSKRYLADALAALDRGLLRAEQLAAGQPAWPQQRGSLVRAYRSRIDDSVQPYAVTVPENYDGKRPMRLDVMLHGRGTTLTEVSFIAAHDSPKASAPAADYIRLDVYGRGNNAYRWAGETDVFEAIESVKSRYAIDPRQVVLRGFSMGGAGAWHLGLHYPGTWAAVEAGAGFTETKRYARLDALPPPQDELLHIYDATDYALNAVDMPFVGYGGEEDTQLQGSTNIREQLDREGFHFRRNGLNWLPTDSSVLFLVGPKTAHKFHPDSKKQSDEFINAALTRQQPRNQLRFVTYTTRYDRCDWLRVTGLEHHYQRAEVTANRSADDTQWEISAKNVTRLVLPELSRTAALHVNGAAVPLPAGLPAASGETLLEKTATGWTVRRVAIGKWEDNTELRKTHGRQGPIDDALCDSFLCVRPTGKPLNRVPHQYALATLDRLAKEFPKWMRGDVRIKDDTAVTSDDIARCNLLLFGDPGSNKLIKQVAGKLPIRWTSKTIEVGGNKYSTADQVLAMIYPNPLNPRRYVLLNSGHTFGAADFRGTNALLYPRLGDYAVLKVGGDGKSAVVLSGLFDERWQVPEK
jgi:hypothetical protein